jgi:hypothetical protein
MILKKCTRIAEVNLPIAVVYSYWVPDKSIDEATLSRFATLHRSLSFRKTRGIQ